VLVAKLSTIATFGAKVLIGLRTDWFAAWNAPLNLLLSQASKRWLLNSHHCNWFLHQLLLRPSLYHQTCSERNAEIIFCAVVATTHVTQECNALSLTFM
jgi:hypothetical protein